MRRYPPRIQRWINKAMTGLEAFSQRHRALDASSLPMSDISDAEWETIWFVEPYTMTNRERLLAAIRAVEYVVTKSIPGDVVECGVWRGGSSMAMALTLKRLGVTDRTLYLYDTFAGMTSPTVHDVDVLHQAATTHLAIATERTSKSSPWCEALRPEVEQNIRSTGYSRVQYVEGPVEATLPATRPEHIALLRLDTDFYASTKHELTHLYPLLVPGGVLIVDDYGHWRGSKQAVDEYFEGQKVYLHRIDYSARILIKR